MSSFDVRVFAIRRRPGRTAFEVRWRVAGRDKSRSFMTWALADTVVTTPSLSARPANVLSSTRGPGNPSRGPRRRR